MEYDVEREYQQWHVREKGQLGRGTTVTDVWLEQMGFGTLTRSNIDAVIHATMASAGGMVLDKSRPRDIAFKPKLSSYPRSRIPERMLFRS